MRLNLDAVPRVYPRGLAPTFAPRPFPQQIIPLVSSAAIAPMAWPLSLHHLLHLPLRFLFYRLAPTGFTAAFIYPAAFPVSREVFAPAYYDIDAAAIA